MSTCRNPAYTNHTPDSCQFRQVGICGGLKCTGHARPVDIGVIVLPHRKPERCKTTLRAPILSSSWHAPCVDFKPPQIPSRLSDFRLPLPQNRARSSPSPFAAVPDRCRSGWGAVRFDFSLFGAHRPPRLVPRRRSEASMVLSFPIPAQATRGSTDTAKQQGARARAKSRNMPTSPARPGRTTPARYAPLSRPARRSARPPTSETPPRPPLTPPSTPQNRLTPESSRLSAPISD